jgi:hypothetical protein
MNPGQGILTTAHTLNRLRLFVLLLLAAEMVGVFAELLLVAHWEGVTQWTPLVLLGLGILALAGDGILRNPATQRAFNLVMLLFVLAGVVGVWLHYDGRVEFRQELDPSLGGWALFKSAMTGSSSPPVLAPGVMIQMGFLGLIAVFRRTADVKIEQA